MPEPWNFRIRPTCPYKDPTLVGPTHELWPSICWNECPLYNSSIDDDSFVFEVIPWNNIEQLNF